VPIAAIPLPARRATKALSSGLVAHKCGIIESALTMSPPNTATVRHWGITPSRAGIRLGTHRLAAAWLPVRPEIPCGRVPADAE
jgi:hypothetical protein